MPGHALCMFLGSSWLVTPLAGCSVHHRCPELPSRLHCPGSLPRDLRPLRLPSWFRLARRLTTQTLTALSLHFPLVDLASLPLYEGESLIAGKVTTSFFPEGLSG